ncbi:alpha/beta fold hydrolase [Hoeflea marina]|uniref:alpha/beta fold hydrolase n=1 Tax=Hoeflea marina TaxID=274592 RepID=UPI001FE23F3D|nr:alpha/beta fold hydrolase [Hoeflea marina]
MHGTPFSSQVWRRIAPLLARHWTVHCFDLIGHGQSEMCDGQDVWLGVQNGLPAALRSPWPLDRQDMLYREFGQLIAGGRLIRVPNAGHLLREDAPEAIIAAMLAPLA